MIKKGDTLNNGTVSNPDYMKAVHKDFPILLVNSKGNAWDGGTPIGIMNTSTGYKMVISEAGKKGITYEELSVGVDGEVDRKGKTIDNE